MNKTKKGYVIPHTQGSEIGQQNHKWNGLSVYKTV